jgi:hypothetical protein
MRTSRGLLPDAERPHCFRHPGNKMRLVRCRQAIFVSLQYSAQRRKAKSFGRKIYRCCVKGCHVVWNGPTDVYHTGKERDFSQTKPW